MRIISNPFVFYFIILFLYLALPSDIVRSNIYVYVALSSAFTLAVGLIPYYYVRNRLATIHVSQASVFENAVPVFFALAVVVRSVFDYNFVELAVVGKPLVDLSVLACFLSLSAFTAQRLMTTNFLNMQRGTLTGFAVFIVVLSGALTYYLIFNHLQRCAPSSSENL
jgi:hypothetical protein